MASNLSLSDIRDYNWRAEAVLDKIINGGAKVAAKGPRVPITQPADFGNIITLFQVIEPSSGKGKGTKLNLAVDTKLKCTGIIINGTEYSPSEVKRLKTDLLKKIMTKGSVSKLEWKGIPQGNGNEKKWGEVIVPTGKVVKTEDFGGKTTAGPGPATAQQEHVTLKLFEILLKDDGYNPSNIPEDKLLTDFRKFIKSDLSKIWSGLEIDPKTGVSKARTHQNAEVRKWYWHFFLQFKQIRDASELPNNKFKVFNMDKFMDFITKEVILHGPTKGDSRAQPWPRFGPISQKDSWNPADIWLVNNTHRYYPATMKALGEAKRIKQINAILINAYRGAKPYDKEGAGVVTKKITNPIIVGVSLKKSVAGSSPKTHEGKVLHYDLLNLKFKGDVLPQVVFDKIPVKIPWDSTKKLFTNVTNTMEVEEQGTNRITGLMKMGSGGGGAESNINLEFSQKGGGAMLGKIPRDILQERLDLAWPSNPGLPTWQEALKSIPSQKDSDSIWNKKIDDWNIKFKKIDTYIGVGTNKIFQVQGGTKLFNKEGDTYKFVNYIIAARRTSDWDSNPARYKSILQITQLIDWYYILAMVFSIGRSKVKFDDFIEDTYYIAQKRGSKFKNFGPFGKLH